MHNQEKQYSFFDLIVQNNQTITGTLTVNTINVTNLDLQTVDLVVNSLTTDDPVSGKIEAQTDLIAQRDIKTDSIKSRTLTNLIIKHSLNNAIIFQSSVGNEIMRVSATDGVQLSEDLNLVSHWVNNVQRMTGYTDLVCQFGLDTLTSHAFIVKNSLDSEVFKVINNGTTTIINTFSLGSTNWTKIGGGADWNIKLINDPSANFKVIDSGSGGIFSMSVIKINSYKSLEMNNNSITGVSSMQSVTYGSSGTNNLNIASDKDIVIKLLSAGQQGYFMDHLSNVICLFQNGYFSVNTGLYATDIYSRADDEDLNLYCGNGGYRVNFNEHDATNIGYISNGDVKLFLGTGGVASNVYYDTGTKKLTFFVSDEKYKENIQDFDIPSKKIFEDIKLKKFTRKNNGQQEIGMLAQDLEQNIIKNLGVENKKLFCLYDEKDELISYKQDELLYLLIDRVKELTSEIDQLKLQNEKIMQFIKGLASGNKGVDNIFKKIF